MASLSVIFLLLQIVGVKAPISSKWSECGCRWEPWAAWSACTATCGGGTQDRDRKVWNYDRPECEGFEACASPGMGWETQVCNTQCFNGGTFNTHLGYYGYCSCPVGKRGSCCEETVRCGKPSSIRSGTVIGSNYDYGHHVTYICNAGFNMTDPSESSRNCSADGYWDGRSPTCLYARSCDSGPCQNGATCTNRLGFYTCTCNSGWTGKNCETDIQPPVLSGCSSNRSVFVSTIMTNQSWTIPTFTDPMGTHLTITSNYQSNSYNFPWGDFTVSYSAAKPANGLSTECVFTISVRPHPCPVVKAPKHGAVLCNGWRTEYARVCIFTCLDGFTYPLGFSSNNWYNCGSSGQWLPPSMLQECIADVLKTPPRTISATVPTLKDCYNVTELNVLKSYYIETLKKSQFNQLCEDYLPLCSADNVDIIC